MGDYAPFYFAPRSPMMYAIERGNVPTYLAGCDHVIYLVATVERLVAMNLRVVFTDRNAVLSVADFTADIGRLEALVDWPLMQARWWNNTAEEPDRGNQACEDQARQALAAVGASMSIAVTPGWYF